MLANDARRTPPSAPAGECERDRDRRDVVILRWPEQASDVDELERRRVPRLLLVDPGAVPPDSDSCLEDWIRLPADDADVRARLTTLTRRAEHHPTRPVVDEFGQLSYRGMRLFLSPIDQRIVETLLAHYDDVVHEDELRRDWPGRGGNGTLRVHVSRLRRRLDPLGLTITSVRNVGYMLAATK